MSEKIKGITLTVGGDTSGLRKELSNVNKETAAIQKELREVDKALKLDPQNTELLAQKQKLLTDAIGTTEEKLEELKKAQEKADKAIADGTEISQKQYRLLQREISNTEAGLKSLKNESKKTNDTIGDIEKPKKGLEDIKGTLGKVTKGAAATGAAVLALASALSQIEEETREYRTDLSKLETNAEEAGVSFDTIKKQLKSVTAITDEADSSIEALSNLLRTNLSENGIEKVVKELSGAVIAFPDTLKIESLADSLQETLATGNATGQFAELLERCGLNLEEFNSGLETSKKLGQEEQYILETLSKTGLAGVNDSYVRTNENLIKIKEAQQEWNDAIAEVGEIVAPIKANIISFGAELINSLIGVNDETDILIDNIQRESSAFWEAKEAQEAKLEGDIAEIDYTIRLHNELKNLVDANGNVLESNKIRVDYILNELSEATGIELELVGNQIQGYNDLSTSIEGMLEKKRAEIILASQEEAYKEAILNIDQKRTEQEELMAAIIEKRIEVENARAEAERMNEEAGNTYIRHLELELEEMERVYGENLSVLNQYYCDKKTYEENYEKFFSGMADEIKAINSEIAESYEKTAEENEETLKRRVASTAIIYAELLQKVAEGNAEINEQEIQDAQSRYEQAIADYQKIGKAIPDGMQLGIEDGKPTLKSTVTGFITQVKNWFTNKDGFDTHSPSKWSEEIAEWVDEGFANGILKNIKPVRAAFRELFNNVEQEAEEQKKLIKETFDEMVEDVKKSIDTLQKDMESYRKGLSKVDLTETKTETLFFFGDKEIKQTTTGLADLSEERETLEKFLENIMNLREIGIDDSMIEEIKALGGDKGGELAQALLDATPEQRETFLNDYKEIGKLSGQVTAEVFKDELLSVGKDTKKLFEELNPDFLKIGEDWGTILGEGITTKLSSMLQNLKDVIGSIDFDYGVNSGIYSYGEGANKAVVNYNTEINQTITATPQTAFETSEATRRVMENIASQAVLS